MNAIHDVPTDKLPAISEGHNHEATKMILPAFSSQNAVLPSRYEESEMLRSVKLEQQGFSWIPVIIFVVVLGFYGCIGCFLFNDIILFLMHHSLF